MADKNHGSRRFAIFIAVLTILLIGAIALFIYGSMTHGVPLPFVVAWRTIATHG